MCADVCMCICTHRYIFIGLFIAFVDWMLMFAHLDLANGMIDVISTAQMFRVIGMMGSTVLLQWIENGSVLKQTAQ